MSTFLGVPEAALPGAPAGDFTLADRYTREDAPVYLSGIQALVRLLADRAKADQRAGATPAAFVSGYEGSPLAGYDLEIARQRKLLELLGVVHRPGVNEELAATAVAGTQLAGADVPFANESVRGITGYWYGKAPGLDRASDAIRHANLGGTSPHGGVVALVGDDPCVHPLDPDVVQRFAGGVDEIVVVEEKRPFLEPAIKDILYGTEVSPCVVGKRDHAGNRLLPATGELNQDLIAGALAKRLARLNLPSVRAWDERRPARRIDIPLVPRTPYFCSGCPHNSSAKVPNDVIVGGGIGCHGMVMGMPDKQTGSVLGVTQMGGEGAHWIGLSPFVKAPHYIQNLGDGTFAHSGSLAVRAAVAAGVDMTFKLLFNSTVAMTGGQDAIGGMTIDRAVELLLVEGAAQVAVTSEEPSTTKRALRHGRVPFRREVSVHHRDDIVAVQEELASIPGVTVLVHDQECAAERRRKRKRGQATTPAERVLINERLCEGCGDCGEKSNCMSVHPVETEFGRKTQIHQSSCNFDFSCLKGNCPSFLTVVPGSKPTKRTASQRPPEARAIELPEPRLRVPQDDFAMRITGIGGTGVVTVAQVLATAAFLDGKYVRSLDQTGVAQKGGAVVSDVKISTTGSARAAKVAGGECDLYLGCDALVAVDPVNLAAADPERTIAVMSTAEVPTGAMVVDTSVTYPDRDSRERRFDGRFSDAHHVDAATISHRELGGEQYANMVMVGAAYQGGALPISQGAIERAIQLNGTQVDANLAAFRLGREATARPTDDPTTQAESSASVPGVVDPRAVRAARARIQAGEGTLAQLVDRRIPELVAYQGRRYAESYADLVERVRAAEHRAFPGQHRLAETVATHLFDLMAYKDEYEVARLALDPAVDERVVAEFGPGSRVSYRLHPPVLRALGMKRKLSLGPWFRSAFRVLYALRRLRGTPLDVFGYARVRKVERQLVRDYRELVARLVDDLPRIGITAAVEVAALPSLVRGYEDVKLANVARYESRLRELSAQLGAPD